MLSHSDPLLFNNVNGVLPINTNTTKTNYYSFLLLAIAFGIGLYLMHWSEFGDEADTIIVSELVAHGSYLYRDIFSHHFPFPYYWVAIFISLFGKSIFVARLSVLLFQMLALIIAMKLSRYYLLIGITALIWSIVKYFYLGHMVLYSSFAGPALLTILVITLSTFAEDSHPTWKHWLTISIFSVISFLSDPLSIYVIAITLLFIFIKTPKIGATIIFTIISLLTLYVGFLFATSSLSAFWADAVVFNSSVYSKYNYTNPIRFSELLSILASGLEITDKSWLNINPFRPVTLAYTQFDQWFFTGFLYRASIIACVIFMLCRKNMWAAGLLYCFAAGTLIINKWDFRAQPFVLVAIFTSVMIVMGAYRHKRFHPCWKLAEKCIRVILAMMMLWLIIRLSGYIYLHRQEATYEAAFSGLEKDSAYLQELSCHQPNTLLAFYPNGSYRNWFANMQPVSKYPFMWPWVAEVGLNEVITTLQEPHLLAIIVRQDFMVWDKYDTRVYLQPLDQFLNQHYHSIAGGIYLSPELYNLCAKQP